MERADSAGGEAGEFADRVAGANADVAFAGLCFGVVFADRSSLQSGYCAVGGLPGRFYLEFGEFVDGREFGALRRIDLDERIFDSV